MTTEEQVRLLKVKIELVVRINHNKNQEDWRKLNNKLIDYEEELKVLEERLLLEDLERELLKESTRKIEELIKRVADLETILNEIDYVEWKPLDDKMEWSKMV